MKKPQLLFLMLFLVAGCAVETAVPDPTPLAVTEIPPTDLPAPVVETAVPLTDVPEPTAAPEETAVVVESGRTPDGAYFLGSPDAPLTLIDYSDFL